jgi:hypothetical protein
MVDVDVEDQKRFFRSLFLEYPNDHTNWKVYTQNAYKICIRFKNKSELPREMKEYRRGNNGEIEKDEDGKPKILKPNETRFIAIEPSSKAYKFDNSETYGSASYPKKPDEAKKHWRLLQPCEIRGITKKIYNMGMEIPFYQIASIYVSLYGGDHAKIMNRIKKEIKSGEITLPHLSIRGPKSVSIGIIINKERIGKYTYFPGKYGNVSLQKGMLILVKLNYNVYKNTKKLKLDNENLIYFIDAPAVKAAIWKPVKKNYRKTIIDILDNVQRNKGL